MTFMTVKFIDEYRSLFDDLFIDSVILNVPLLSLIYREKVVIVRIWCVIILQGIISRCHNHWLLTIEEAVIHYYFWLARLIDILFFLGNHLKSWWKVKHVLLRIKGSRWCLWSRLIVKFFPPLISLRRVDDTLRWNVFVLQRTSWTSIASVIFWVY